MEIIRIQEDLNQSRIDGILISNLPSGLKERVVDLLEKFDGVEGITVGDCAENTILVTDEPFTLFEFAGEDEGLTGELFFVRKLYKFWDQKRWGNNADGCFFCGRERTTGSIICADEFCQQAASEFDEMIGHKNNPGEEERNV